ncbi:MAG: MBL fold metallo-hydrolase [Candidatus Hermodarchaeota archaeon]
MVQEVIITESRKINNYLYHIDLKEFGTRKILSSYIAEFDDCTIFLDCGTSLEINKLLNFAKEHNISLNNAKYLIPTHHHFDHAGGMWKLYEIVKKYNSKIKILTNEATRVLLNKYESHLNRAKRTFGQFIGEMKPIEDQAFNIIEPMHFSDGNIKNIEIIDEFKKNGSEIQLAVLKTPGHTHDHQCPVFIKDGKIDFIYFGESVGTIYHSSKLITLPTSMPVYFNFMDYMKSLSNLIKIKPKSNYAGFGHFGVIKGNENINKILLEHKEFMELFRQEMINAYNEDPQTKHVVEKLTPILTPRTDLIKGGHPILSNIILGIVYGMMIDLGYRKD